MAGNKISRKPQARVPLVAGAGLVATLAVGAIAVGLPDLAKVIKPEQAGEGQRLYLTHCAACHGQQLEGAKDWNLQRDDLTFPPPPHDRTGHTWHHSDRYLVDYIKSGGNGLQTDRVRRTMPAFADTLTDSQIKAVITYIKSSWPKEIRDAQEKQNAMAE